MLQAKNAYSLLRLHGRLLLLAKLKGNMVYFERLVTFLGRRGGQFTPSYPLDP